jgi:hypothetical protein
MDIFEITIQRHSKENAWLVSKQHLKIQQATAN